MVNCQETLLSTSPGKDSGFESAEDAELIPLSLEQLMKIRLQVEFYLSNEVVTKDQFLLKHVTKSKEGWLSLKLMSSFRKVKSLCKGYDWRVVAEALKDSELLEVNDDGSKVRRRTAIPSDDETRPARTIVAFADKRVPTLETVTEAFGECGSFLNVKFVQPGELLDDSMKKVFGKNPKARQLTCAVIEFERSEHAQDAQKLTTDYEVILLKDCMKATNKIQKIANRERRTFSDSEVQKRQPTAKSTAPASPLSWRDRSQPIEVKSRTKSFTQGQKPEPKEPKRKPSTVPDLKEPEVRPRRFTFSETSPTNCVCAIRQPRGPDGTRGFLVKSSA